MNYILLKTKGKRKNYFVKSSFPVRNQKQAKNLLTLHYKEEFTENNLNEKNITIYQLNIFKFYFFKMLDKIYD